MQVNDTRLYRVKAVAGMFDVSVATIYRAIESGALEALKIGAGKGAIRVPGHAIAAYWQACTGSGYGASVTEGESACDADANEGREVA